MLQRLDSALAHVDEYIRQRMAQAQTPGLALAITDDNRTLRSTTYGVADLGTRAPVTPETLFALGSIGKTFTAVATLQAAEQGLLDVHAPVTEYLPWLEVPSSYAPITLHHLLSHSAGIVRGTEFSPDPRGMVWALRELPATFAPGTQFHYSDLGYKIVGLVLERVYSRSYAEIIQSGILDPLDMRATVPVMTHQDRPRFAVGYASLYDDRPRHSSHPLVPAAWVETNSGDGCIASTAEDMATFARMLLDNGRGPHGPIISQSRYDLMTQEVVPDSDYGYGINTFTAGGVRHIGHRGDMPGYEAYLWLDMDNRFGLILLVTQPYPSSLSFSLLRMLRAGILGEPSSIHLPVPDPTQVSDGEASDPVDYPTHWDAYTGHFRAYNPWEPSFRVVVRQGQLLLIRPEGAEEALSPLDDGSFRIGEETWSPERVQFDQVADGQALRAVVSGCPYYRFFTP